MGRAVLVSLAFLAGVGLVGMALPSASALSDPTPCANGAAAGVAAAQDRAARAAGTALDSALARPAEAPLQVFPLLALVAAPGVDTNACIAMTGPCLSPLNGLVLRPSQSADASKNRTLALASQGYAQGAGAVQAMLDSGSGGAIGAATVGAVRALNDTVQPWVRDAATATMRLPGVVAGVGAAAGEALTALGPATGRAVQDAAGTGGWTAERFVQLYPPVFDWAEVAVTDPFGDLNYVVLFPFTYTVGIVQGPLPPVAGLGGGPGGIGGLGGALEPAQDAAQDALDPALHAPDRLGAAIGAAQALATAAAPSGATDALVGTAATLPTAASRESDAARALVVEAPGATNAFVVGMRGCLGV